MISLNVGDKIQGDATNASQVDYVISGLAAINRTALANGQLAAATGDLYTATGQDTVLSLVLVNTGAGVNNVNLYYLPNGGTARHIISENLSLQPKYSLHSDGPHVMTMDQNGGIVEGTTVSDAAFSSSWSGVTTVAPSKNAIWNALGTGSSPTFVGENLSGLTASQLVATDGAKNLQSLAVATYPSLAELAYVKGVTSGIQAQLNGKLGSLSGAAILAGISGGQTLNGGTLTTNLLNVRANAIDLTSGYVHFLDTTTATNTTTAGVVMDGGLAVAKKIYATDLQITNAPTLTALTASLPVVTDGSKNLASLALTGATSLRKSLGLETTDSPTFTAASLTSAIADNDSSTLGATTAYAKSKDAVLARDPDQGVALTAAASGSSGITVANDANINFGTGNFALVWKGSLPDWTTCGALINKGPYIPFFDLSISTGKPDLYYGTGASHIVATVANTKINGTVGEVVAVIVKETVTTNGSVTFYVDGVMLGVPVVITATAPGTTTNTDSLYILGNAVARAAGTCIHAYTLNFAPTAAEVLDMYRNGIPEAWKWGSQTNRIAAAADSTFASWTGNWGANLLGGSVADGTGKMTLTTLSGLCGANLISPYVSLPVVGKRYQVQADVWKGTSATTSFLLSYGGVAGAIVITGSQATCAIEVTAISTDQLYIYTSAGDGGTIFIDNVIVTEIGATLALTPESWQSDKPYDCSSNNLVCAYPATGWSLTRPNPKKLWQPTPTAKTTAVTLTIADLLTGIITATHTAGATQGYTLPTGALCDAWPVFGPDRFCEWSLINLSAAALDTVTITAGASHTFVGNPIVQSANAATGGVMGNSAMFRTRKISAGVFETYRIA